MLKLFIVAGCSVALVGAAAAADLPRPQPVYSQAATVGKAPIGKTPIGKSPKSPKSPVVARY